MYVRNYLPFFACVVTFSSSNFFWIDPFCGFGWVGISTKSVRKLTTSTGTNPNKQYTHNHSNFLYHPLGSDCGEIELCQSQNHLLHHQILLPPTNSGCANHGPHHIVDTLPPPSNDNSPSFISHFFVLTSICNYSVLSHDIGVTGGTGTASIWIVTHDRGMGLMWYAPPITDRCFFW